MEAWFNGPRLPDDPGRYIPMATRRAVLARDGNVCQYCDHTPADDFDHIYPFAQGGTHHPHNLAITCAPCNVIAGMRTFSEFVMKQAYILARRDQIDAAVLAQAYKDAARGLRVNLDQ